MTISVWRYSHLALAVSSFLFIVLASLTGIILAFQPISQQLKPYKVADLDAISIAETVAVFKNTYPEIIEIKTDANHFVTASVFTNKGDNLEGYFNPKTAKYLGKIQKPSPFFKWVTSLHRSLFLKKMGRFFVGLCSFLLFLITITGSLLIIKRQRGIKRFFSKIINENFNQYWHIVLGRFFLIPIVIITITGVCLSAEKFNVFPKNTTSHQINFETLSKSPKRPVNTFAFFKNTMLSEVKSIEFPFSNTVEDYFTLKLKNKSVIINQFTGEILSEIKIPKTKLFSSLSLNLHTGKGSILWSVILAIATGNILFFIYSGFAMTLKRRQARIKNKYKANNAEIIILVGSENGSTMLYANAFYKALIENGKRVFITEMNNYSVYPKAKYFVVMAATYGQGEAPTNANQFLKKVKTKNNNSAIKFTVVGFGALAYPNFCQFAYHVEQLLQQKYQPLLPIFTINDKSVEAFNQWIEKWVETTGILVNVAQQNLINSPKQLKKIAVVGKTKNNIDDTFLITLSPKKQLQFTSGDLLAIYPKNDYRERLYSIGKVDGNIQLSVRYYKNGLGSGYLNALENSKKLKARVIKNTAFYFPKKATRVIMIANGTGIAPFLGMLSQNKNTETQMYLGLRTQASFKLYQPQVKALIQCKKLKHFNLVLSQESKKQYVQDALRTDANLIVETLSNKGVIMICGSLAMYKGVMRVLEDVLESYNAKPLSYYKNNNQIKSDCY